CEILLWERGFLLTNAAVGRLLTGVFVREKHINGYTYLYLVETVREDGRTKQRILKNLGRKDAVLAAGSLERLASSVARYQPVDKVGCCAQRHSMLDHLAPE